MSEGINHLEKKLTAFKRKYYLNLFLRGALLSLSLVLIYFLIASLLEYNLWLGGTARFLIFGSFVALVAFCIYRFLREPIGWWLYKKGIGQEESARMIGLFFPSINDRLLNVIQLSKEAKTSVLLQAGIVQKTKQFEHVSFESAIDLSDNRKYLKYFVIPFLLILILWVFNHRIFTQSTTRIVQFNREFSPEAPFQFLIENKSLEAFFNEDFQLQLKLTGDATPDAVYIVSNQQRLKTENVSAGAFSYVFEKLQHEISFQFEGSGFYSDRYTITLINRPELAGLNVQLDYPKYLGRKSEQLTNAANLEVPEGTRVTWKVNTANASSAKISFSTDPGTQNKMQSFDNQWFGFSKGFNNPDQYSIFLENDRSRNRDNISYSVEVIKDQFPEVVVDQFRDSLLYKNILLGGAVKDDHGVTELKVQYQIVNNNQPNGPVKGITIPVNYNQAQQNFFFTWNLDSLKLNPGDQLNYYLQVWDNDGVNGRKTSKSSVYKFQLPSEEELKAEISKSQSSAESKIDQSLNKAKDLRQSIDEAQQKLKGKQTLDWQDKKMLENLLEQKKNLDQVINDLKKENQLLEQKKESFSEESKRIKEKSEQIQKLMNELLDEETRKLFQELEKLLNENSDLNQMQKLLDKMDRKEINLEKELERTLQLFKQLQYDYKLEQAINELKEQTRKQEELLEKTQELTGEKKPEEKEDNKKGDKSSDQKDKDPKNDQTKGDQSNKEPKGDKKDGENKNQNRSDQKNKDDQPKGDDKNSKGSNEKQKEPNPEELAKQQEKLNEEFNEFEKTVDDLEKLGEELNEPGETPSDQEKKDVKDSQQQSKESLQQGKPKKSTESQKKAVQQMKQMQQKLEGMQNSMEMEINMENMEALRQILHGLIKLSFDEESLMKEFVPILQTDPKYIQLSQNQLKIKDDAKVLEDSLLSLGKRDPFMGSVVTKEVGELNDHIEKSMENIRERRKANAGSEMQMTMTSINNLALMLNDHFDMMMDMMANAMPSPGKKKKGKQQSLSEMQQQLNEQMEQIKKGSKSGRELSEEMAKMAAEQERIRRSLQEMQEKLKQEGGKPLGNDIPGKMEQTEMELVNKQITEQTIRRQKEIMTRLLEAEKSMREQNMDEERKGEAAKDYQKEMPRAFEEYLRLKEKEVELLKTVPPKLYPYYKKEVSEYFKRIGTQD
jgi:hypothetical protein